MILVVKKRARCQSRFAISCNRRLLNEVALSLESATYELPNLQVFCFDSVATVPGGRGSQGYNERET